MKNSLCPLGHNLSGKLGTLRLSCVLSTTNYNKFLDMNFHLIGTTGIVTELSDETAATKSRKIFKLWETKISNINWIEYFNWQSQSGAAQITRTILIDTGSFTNTQFPGNVTPLGSFIGSWCLSNYQLNFKSSPLLRFNDACGWNVKRLFPVMRSTSHFLFRYQIVFFSFFCTFLTLYQQFSAAILRRVSFLFWFCSQAKYPHFLQQVYFWVSRIREMSLA